jgi:hypothetical protein
MADTKTLTGALAIIRVNGTPIGKMRNWRMTESIRRVEVMGLGTLLTSETPATAWTGSLSCDFYEINFKDTGIPGAIRRDVQTNQEFEDQLLLNTDGVQVDLFKKVSDLVDPNTRLIKPKATPYASIKRFFIESDGMDLAEGAISGHSQSGRYLDPVLFPV